MAGSAQEWACVLRRVCPVDGRGCQLSLLPVAQSGGCAGPRCTGGAAGRCAGLGWAGEKSSSRRGLRGRNVPVWCLFGRASWRNGKGRVQKLGPWEQVRLSGRKRSCGFSCDCVVSGECGRNPECAFSLNKPFILVFLVVDSHCGSHTFVQSYSVVLLNAYFKRVYGSVVTWELGH